MQFARPFSSLVDVLRYRAAEHPGDKAYAFLSERGGEEAALTFAELERRAATLAGRLAAGAKRGDRALLVFPPGLEFIEAFFGCLVAGLVPVPMMVPRRVSARDSSTAIVADCTPRIALTTRALADVRPDIIERFRQAGLAWEIVEPQRAPADVTAAAFPAPTAEDLAFLQYTSGSTSSPKGVMVTHGNLLANLEMIRTTLAYTRASTHVSWVPLHHDMGLILNVLETHFIGALCVLMSPPGFIKRPHEWLRAIGAYRAQVTSAPNFAYDLCVSRFRAESMKGVDLSCWKEAVNAAEPVRADTIARFCTTFQPYGFNPGAMRPLYGLAEATLLVSAARASGAGAVVRGVSRAALQSQRIDAPIDRADEQAVVGCGRTVAGQAIAIVDPQTAKRLQPDQIGEVWVSGPSVACGYWRNAEATNATFRARIEGESREYWLRTGDLGFLDGAGELFITGRIKDVIIINGINHYPQDIEHTVQESHPALRRDHGAAFGILDQNNVERLVIVQEVERTARKTVESDDIAGCIREALFDAHELSAYRIVLIPPGELPKTTSGKIQRNLTRTLWQQGSLTEVGRNEGHAGPGSIPSATAAG
ncbi:MAG TPA: fatty acyl-AMP ligase [Xanthobacteraceae bacterium]|nr:fatty acyl-AMP ligase [Xanthobacteraceae bacterium]